MQFSRDQLANMGEDLLLRFVIDFYQLAHPELKALDVLANEVGFTPQAFSNYLAGRGAIGLRSLVHLYRVTSCDLIPDWIRVQSEEVFARKVHR